MNMPRLGQSMNTLLPPSHPATRPVWPWMVTHRICSQVGRLIPIPQWWQAELRQATKLKAVHVWPYWGMNRYYRYTVEISTDGKTWEQVGDRGKNTGPSTPDGDVIEFTPRAVRYIRINMLYHNLNPGVHIVEVDVTPAE